MVPKESALTRVLIENQRNIEMVIAYPFSLMETDAELDNGSFAK